MSPRYETSPRGRMPAPARKDLLIEAAMRAFARGGYAGTSTDAIAKEGGVSQPLVVRTFGTKLELFLLVFDRACATIRERFEMVLEESTFDPADDEDWGRLGAAYTDLLRDRDLLMVMMHGFAASDIDQIATHSRDNMGAIFETIMATGCTEDRAQEFVAQGMLLNVMLSIRANEHLGDNPLTPLTRCAFGEALAVLS